MRDSALDRNREKFLHDLGRRAERARAELLLDVPLEHGGSDEDPQAPAPELLGQGAVVELADDSGVQ